MNLLSVIVPVYNVENFLPKCLNSLIDQTYKNLEIILIDDGSTDNSGKICDEYAERDDRIKVIHQKNQGVSVARNTGLNLAKGKYITFVDSDDWCEKDYFREVFEEAKKFENAEIIITNFIKDFGNNNLKLMHPNGKIKIFNKYNALKNMIRGNLYGWEICSTFYKKENIKRIKFSNNIIYGEDFGFKWNVIRNSSGNILYLPIVGYHYVFRKNSAVNSYDIEKKITSLSLQEDLIKNEKNIKYKSLLQEKYLSALLYYCKEYYLLNVRNKSIEQKIKKVLFAIVFNKNVYLKLKIKCLIIFLPMSLVKMLILYRRRKSSDECNDNK